MEERLKNDEKLELIPNVSLGPFKIGHPIEKYLHYKYEMKYIAERSFSYYSYSFIDYDVVIWVEDGVVETISCQTQCYLGGVNLIGLNLDEFLLLTKQYPNDIDVCYVSVSEKRGQNQKVYGFDSLGVQLWVWRNKIRTVLVTSYGS